MKKAGLRCSHPRPERRKSGGSRTARNTATPASKRAAVCNPGRVVQRRVMYLGEIHDRQPAAWRKTLEVFDEQQPGYTTLSLFPEGRPVPSEAVDSVQVKLHEMKLRRARPYGNCWLGCERWRQLELDRFWEQKRERGREAGSWAQVLELLVVNRRIEPGSELRGTASGSIRAPWTCG